MVDSRSEYTKTWIEPAGIDSSARPRSYDALSMAAPSRISSRTVRQDGRHAGGHRLYHCQEREATGCRCDGKATKRGLHKNEFGPKEELQLILCMGAAACLVCKQCKYPIGLIRSRPALFAP